MFIGSYPGDKESMCPLLPPSRGDDVIPLKAAQQEVGHSKTAGRVTRNINYYKNTIMTLL